jgi:hypothetical protein
MLGVLGSLPHITLGESGAGPRVETENAFAGAEYMGGFDLYQYVLSDPIAVIDPTGLGFWDGDNWFHEWVAEVFWFRVHSTETLATMSDTRATVEAVGLSVVIGAGGYFGATYGYAAVTGRAGWVGLRAGMTRGGLHFAVGSNAGWAHFLGPTGYMTATEFIAGWGIPILMLPARHPEAIARLTSAGQMSYNCLSGALYALFTAL